MVEPLLFWRIGSLPSYVCKLGGLREDLYWGAGKLTTPSNLQKMLEHNIQTKTQKSDFEDNKL